VGDNGVGLSALAASGVVDHVGNVLVDGERLTSHSRLINGQKGVSRAVLLVTVVVLVTMLFGGVVELRLQFPDVVLIAIGVVVATDDAGISWDDLAVLNNDLRDVNCTVPTYPGGVATRLTRPLGELTMSPGTNSRALISCS
jgi:hypothetical protein